MASRATVPVSLDLEMHAVSERLPDEREREFRAHCGAGRAELPAAASMSV